MKKKRGEGGIKEREKERKRERVSESDEMTKPSRRARL